LEQITQAENADTQESIKGAKFNYRVPAGEGRRKGKGFELGAPAWGRPLGGEAC